MGTEKSRRRNSNLNLEKDTTSFLKRKSISKGSTEKLMEGRRKSRAGSIFSLSKPDGSGTDSRRQSMVGNRRQGGSKFKDLVKRTRVLNRLQSDGKSFSGLPITYYIPELDTADFQLFENTYQMTPNLVFNATLAEEKVVEVVDAFAAKYYIRSDAVQGVRMMCDEVRD